MVTKQNESTRMNAGDLMKLLPYSEEGVPLLDFALIGSFFFRDGHTVERRKLLLACLERYVELCGDQLRHYAVKIGDERNKWKAYRPDAVSVISRKFINDDGSTGYFRLTGGEELEIATPYFCHAIVAPQWKQERLHEQSFFQFRLPFDWYAYHSGNFPDLFRWFAATLQVNSGFGGLGFAVADDRNRQLAVENLIYHLAEAIPCLVVDKGYYESDFLSKGLREGNFMTAMADEWAEKLGGADKIAADLGYEFTVMRNSSGITIQAGTEPNPLGPSIYKPFPRLPDMPEAEKLRELEEQLSAPMPPTDPVTAYPLYHKLNQVLKPIRVKPEDYEWGLQNGQLLWRGEAFFDKPRTYAWFARFD